MISGDFEKLFCWYIILTFMLAVMWESLSNQPKLVGTFAYINQAARLTRWDLKNRTKCCKKINRHQEITPRLIFCIRLTLRFWAQSLYMVPIFRKRSPCLPSVLHLNSQHGQRSSLKRGQASASARLEADEWGKTSATWSWTQNHKKTSISRKILRQQHRFAATNAAAVTNRCSMISP